MNVLTGYIRECVYAIVCGLFSGREQFHTLEHLVVKGVHFSKLYFPVSYVSCELLCTLLFSCYVCGGFMSGGLNFNSLVLQVGCALLFSYLVGTGHVSGGVHFYHLVYELWSC